MYLHSRIVPEGSGKRRAAGDMATLKARIGETSELLNANDTVRSSLDFLAKLIDSWF